MCHSVLPVVEAFPPIRIGENDPEDAAPGLAIAVDEGSAIKLAQLTGNIQPQPRAPASRRKERFEYLVRGSGIDAMALVEHLKERLTRPATPPGLQFDQDAAGFTRILDRVVAEVPQDLAQVTGIHAGFQVVGDVADRELSFLQLQGAHEFEGEVLDSGLGVDATTVDKIFEPFFTARSGGTGLGLYISRELCELNRATLLYLDRPGGGSIFRIVFSDPDRWDRQDTE